MTLILKKDVDDVRCQTPPSGTEFECRPSRARAPLSEFLRFTSSRLKWKPRGVKVGMEMGAKVQTETNFVEMSDLLESD